jgi:hydrogenase/urease accessory protein HupE
MRFWLAAVIPLLAPLAGAALAHEVRPGFLELRETSPGEFATTWKVPALGAMRLAIEPAYPRFCRAIGEPVTSFVEDAFVQRGRLGCDRPLAGAEIIIRGLTATQTDVLVRIETADGETETGRVTPSRPAFLVPEQSGALAVLETYCRLGVEHILGGVDHLLFVLGLVLLVHDLRRLLWTVTAFTLAHSVALAAATLGWVNVPSAPVEAAIALSIVFLACELLREPADRSDLAHRYPWVIAFAFGLLHGLGFAGALAEVGLPKGEIPLALFAFNLGVELGQLAFVAAVLAVGFVVLRLLSRRLVPLVARAMAYGIGGIAAFWTIERMAAAGGWV